jgi:sec-independent protein translocase protein TatB
MFDIGWSELLVVGALALIVVGPKDLPRMLRTFGKYTAQARGMARDFQRSMEDAAREADLTEMKELRDTARQLGDLRRDMSASALTTSRVPAPMPPVPTPGVATPHGAATLAPTSAIQTPAAAPAVTRTSASAPVAVPAPGSAAGPGPG